MYYVYMLRCKDGSIYTGITTDVKRRFMEHMQDEKKGAKYTKGHVPEKIEAYWETLDKKNASKLEYHIKKLPKGKKQKLINTDDFIIFDDKIDKNNYKRRREEILHY